MGEYVDQAVAGMFAVDLEDTAAAAKVIGDEQTLGNYRSAGEDIRVHEWAAGPYQDLNNSLATFTKAWRVSTAFTAREVERLAENLEDSVTSYAAQDEEQAKKLTALANSVDDKGAATGTGTPAAATDAPLNSVAGPDRTTDTAEPVPSDLAADPRQPRVDMGFSGQFVSSPPTALSD